MIIIMFLMQFVVPIKITQFLLNEKDQNLHKMNSSGNLQTIDISNQNNRLNISSENITNFKQCECPSHCTCYGPGGCKKVCWK